MLLEAALPPDSGIQPPPRFGERLRGIVLRPRETFARMRDPDAWFWPAILLLIGNLVCLLGEGVVYGRFWAEIIARDVAAGIPATADLDAAIAGNPRARLVPAVITAAMIWATPLAAAWTWLLRTTLFYGLALALGGATASWSRVAAMVGWAWVPHFIQHVLLGALLLSVPGAAPLLLDLPDEHSVKDPTGLFLRGLWVVAIQECSPLSLWNLVLCVIGVREVFRLPRWKAALVVLIPAVLQLVVVTLLTWSNATSHASLYGMPGPDTAEMSAP